MPAPHHKTNTFQFLVSDGTTQADSLYGLSNVTDGAWHHAVGIADRTGNMQYLYVDNVLRDSESIAAITGSVSNAEDFKVGEDTDFFNGIIDDARIWNRALSADEVKQLYLMGR